jgi:hypothetical protein
LRATDAVFPIARRNSAARGRTAAPLFALEALKLQLLLVQLQLEPAQRISLRRRRRAGLKLLKLLLLLVQAKLKRAQLRRRGGRLGERRAGRQAQGEKQGRAFHAAYLAITAARDKLRPRRCAPFSKNRGKALAQGSGASARRACARLKMGRPNAMPFPAC